MSALRNATAARVDRKMCLGCGFDGAELQGHLAHVRYRCPSCGHDLYARPPRSYAEMEGLAPVRTPPRSARMEEWAVRLMAIEAEQRKSRRRVVVTSCIVGVFLALSLLIGLMPG